MREPTLLKTIRWRGRTHEGVEWAWRSRPGCYRSNDRFTDSRTQGKLSGRCSDVLCVGRIAAFSGQRNGIRFALNIRSWRKRRKEQKKRKRNFWVENTYIIWRGRMYLSIVLIRRTCPSPWLLTPQFLNRVKSDPILVETTSRSN